MALLDAPHPTPVLNGGGSSDGVGWHSQSLADTASPALGLVCLSWPRTSGALPWRCRWNPGPRENLKIQFGSASLLQTRGGNLLLWQRLPWIDLILENGPYLRFHPCWAPRASWRMGQGGFLISQEEEGVRGCQAGLAGLPAPLCPPCPIPRAPGAPLPQAVGLQAPFSQQPEGRP